ncbi:hypothetical protein BOO88_24330 [Stutzerimonas stutzeri]|nr:hypothetical protein BOO88_24330 [Stutzerimonas stutzeri]
MLGVNPQAASLVGMNVGASLLAMDVNDNVCVLNELGAFAFIASRLAPTDKRAVLPRAPAAASQRLLYFLK